VACKQGIKNRGGFYKDRNPASGSCEEIGDVINSGTFEEAGTAPPFID
jgi:hypothetical protein